jgi:hypothetical protein
VLTLHSTVLRLRAGQPGFDSRYDFSLRYDVQTGSAAHTASYPMCTGVIFSGIKRPGSDANHSSPSSAEVKNSCSYTSIPPYTCMARCFLKHSRQLTLPLSILRFWDVIRSKQAQVRNIVFHILLNTKHEYSQNILQISSAVLNADINPRGHVTDTLETDPTVTLPMAFSVVCFLGCSVRAFFKKTSQKSQGMLDPEILVATIPSK